MKYIISAIILFTIGFFMNAQEFFFESKKIPLNTRFDTLITIGDTVKTEIPVTVINGKQKGPVLGIITWNHGDDYSQIIAIQKLIQKTNPHEIKGTLLIVNIPNVPSLMSRVSYVDLMKSKNLNKSSSKNEKETEQIREFITKKIINRCNYLIHMCTGDAYDDIIPYAGFYNYYSDVQLSEITKAMAQNMGFNYVVALGNNEKIANDSIYTSRKDKYQHIPTVFVECSNIRQEEGKEVQDLNKALDNLMIYLQMQQGVKSNIPSILIEEKENIISNSDGIFYSDVKAGDHVKKGQKIGYITDFFGNKQEEIKAVVSGIVLYKIGTLPVKKGDQLFDIGIIYM